MSEKKIIIRNDAPPMDDVLLKATVGGIELIQCTNNNPVMVNFSASGAYMLYVELQKIFKDAND